MEPFGIVEGGQKETDESAKRLARFMASLEQYNKSLEEESKAQQAGTALLQMMMQRYQGQPQLYMPQTTSSDDSGMGSFNPLDWLKKLLGKGKGGPGNEPGIAPGGMPSGLTPAQQAQYNFEHGYFTPGATGITGGGNTYNAWIDPLKKKPLPRQT